MYCTRYDTLDGGGDKDIVYKTAGTLLRYNYANCVPPKYRLLLLRFSYNPCLISKAFPKFGSDFTILIRQLHLVALFLQSENIYVA